MNVLYLEFAPPPPLAPFVERFWALEDHIARDGAPPAPVFPDGRMELVVHYGDPFTCADEQGRWSQQSRRIIAGQITGSIHLRPTGRAGVIGARFRPGGAHALLRCSQDELTDLLVDLDVVVKLPFLQETVEEAAHPAGRVAAFAAALMPRLADAPRPNRAIQRAIQSIERADCAESIRDVARACGMSTRGLERLFRRHVGLSPKLFARIARFQRVMTALSNGSQMSGAELAAANGYYDQPHFCRDIKAFTGLAPSELELQQPSMTSFFLRASAPRVASGLDRLA